MSVCSVYAGRFGAGAALAVSRSFAKVRVQVGTDSERTSRPMEQLQATNEALKSKGVKGRIVVVRQSLFLRGTFTASDGTRKDRKICLDLPAHQGQLLTAENRVLQLAEIIQTTGIVPDEMPWDAPPPPSPSLGQTGERPRDAITVGDALERLEEDFWKGKIRTSAAKRTWDRLKAEVDRLPAAATLTVDLLVAVGEKQEPGSRTRQEFLKVAKRTAKLVGIEGTDRLDELKTPYEPAVRDVPDDEDIGAFLGVTPDDDTWKWATWALVTYGCRPSEVFSLRPEPNGTAQVLTIKQKGKAPKWRTALELPVSYPRDEGDNFSPPLIPLKYNRGFIRARCREK